MKMVAKELKLILPEKDIKPKPTAYSLLNNPLPELGYPEDVDDEPSFNPSNNDDSQFTGDIFIMKDGKSIPIEQHSQEPLDLFNS